MTEQEFEIERGKIRKLRIGLLRAYAAKLQTAMSKLNPRDASWAEVTAGLKMVADGLRVEYRSIDLVPAEPQPAADQAPAVASETKPFAGLRLKIHKPSQQDVA